MPSTTSIKDGLILLVIAGVAVGGYLVARKVIDGVGSIGQGISEVYNDAKQAVVNTATTAVEGGTVAPSGQFLPYNNTVPTHETDYQNEWLRIMAAGNLGA